MKKLIFILILSIVSLNFYSAFANEASDLFTKANENYKNGNYNFAIENYRKILDNGFESAELYYNLGNSYFRMNKIPDAILNLERAKRLAGDDEDINYNLNIANLKIVDKIESVPQFFLFQWLKNIRMLFNSSNWAITSIIFLWLSMTALGSFFVFWSVFLRKLLFAVAVLSFIISLTTFTFSYQEYVHEITRNEAIVFSPSAYVKSSPEAAGTDLFILHEGTKVIVLDEIGDWKKIRLLNGNVGWLLGKSIEVI